MSEQLQQDLLSINHYFVCPVYYISKPEFIDSVKVVADERLDAARKNMPMDKIFPVVQSNTFHNDPRLDSFMLYVAGTSWNILYEQGYDMDNFNTGVIDLWAQEHHHLSSHPEHVHSFGSQITGFYILEAPEDCSKIAIHDPKPAKRQINLPLRSMEDLSIGSLAVYFTPKAGDLFLINSFVPHEFTRNVSEVPFKFIHFNIAAIAKPFQTGPTNQIQSTAEII